MRRHLRPPQRDRLPDTPEGYEAHLGRTQHLHEEAACSARESLRHIHERAARKALLEDLREELDIAREQLRTAAPRAIDDCTITVAVLEDRVRALEGE